MTRSDAPREADDRPAGGGGPGRIRRRLRHLPAALIATCGLLVVGVAAGGLLAGAPGAAGAAAGVALVALSYTASSLVLAWADAVNPQLVLPVGLGTYAVKFVVLGVAVAALGRSGWSGLPAFGVAVIGATIVWTVAQAVWTWRAKILYTEPDS